MISSFKILRKPGWRINPDDKKVTEILRKLHENDGLCPTLVHNRIGHIQCPCSEYIQKNICHCNLYVRDDVKRNIDNKSVDSSAFYGGC